MWWMAKSTTPKKNKKTFRKPLDKKGQGDTNNQQNAQKSKREINFSFTFYSHMNIL